MNGISGHLKVDSLEVPSFGDSWSNVFHLDKIHFLLSSEKTKSHTFSLARNLKY